MEYRIEHDALGEVAVPKDAPWAAQTQRSLMNFAIGEERMPREIIYAFALLKSGAARANRELRVLGEEECDMICRICGEILAGDHDDAFPLRVWQTGSGTQSNMNVNEVIAHLGNEAAGRTLLHPNDTVNRSQSSNDTFPGAMHIAAAKAVSENLLPAVGRMIGELKRLEEENRGVVKIGRTHLMDAVPLTFAQEISGWRGMLEECEEMINASLPKLCTLALGGTAVGTGLNAPEGFAEAAAAQIANDTGLPFVTARNKFQALTSKDAFVFAHGALKALAADLMKIANDVRFLASGPRCGFSEIHIPENEPGSSIMPGKVNPTQCEAVTMVAVQVMGNDAAIGFAASQGNFELNVFMPVIAYNFLQSVRLLSDVILSFCDHALCGLTANKDKMKEYVDRSLMLVTALNPVIGYENAAKVAQNAFAKNISLRESAADLGLLDADEFDRLVRPEKMTGEK